MVRAEAGCSRCTEVKSGRGSTTEGRGVAWCSPRGGQVLGRPCASVVGTNGRSQACCGGCPSVQRSRRSAPHPLTRRRVDRALNRSPLASNHEWLKLPTMAKRPVRSRSTRTSSALSADHAGMDNRALVRLRAIPAPSDRTASPLAPESLLLEPPPSLPSITPSVLLDAVASVMVATRNDERQLTKGEHRWERTIRYQYESGTETTITVSGDLRYGLLRPPAVRLLLQVIARWAAEGCPEQLPVTVQDLAALTGENRRLIPDFLHAAASLHITGRVRPAGALAEPVDVNYGVFSLATFGSRIAGLMVDPFWRAAMDAGLRTFLDVALLQRLRHPLAMRLYLFLAAECSAGRVTRLSSTVGASALTDSAFTWHRRLFGYDLDASSTNASRFYTAFEMALDELATFRVVGSASAVRRVIGGQKAPLRTMIAVQPGPALELLPLMRSTLVADSTRNRHLLLHLLRLGVNAPTARELLAAGADVVTRALLQVYHRRDERKLPPKSSWAAFLVDAVRNARTWNSDATALAWAQGLLLESSRPRGAPRASVVEEAVAPPRELAAFADLLRTENAATAARTKLLAHSMTTADVDGTTLTLSHLSYAVEHLRTLTALPDEQAKLWSVIDRCFPETRECIVAVDGKRLAILNRPD